MLQFSFESQVLLPQHYLFVHLNWLFDLWAWLFYFYSFKTLIAFPHFVIFLFHLQYPMPECSDAPPLIMYLWCKLTLTAVYCQFSSVSAHGESWKLIAWARTAYSASSDCESIIAFVLSFLHDTVSYYIIIIYWYHK